MSRILLIDDDEQLCLELQAGLSLQGHDLISVHDGRSGVAATAARSPDLLLVELGLPDMDGLEVVTRIRGFSAVPIVVLTARNGQADKVQALDAGADDYVTKPFDVEELAARLRAALRRGPGAEMVTRVVAGDLEVDLSLRELTIRGARVALTRTELALLEVFVGNPGRLLSHDWLLKQIWGPEYGEEKAYLRTYIGQLRRKLEDDASHPRFIRTEPGLGYRWIAASPAAPVAGPA